MDEKKKIFNTYLKTTTTECRDILYHHIINCNLIMQCMNFHLQFPYKNHVLEFIKIK